MNDSKDHHYCPKFYLKGFSNSNKKLWSYDKTKKHQPYKEVFPTQIMFERFLYSIEDDHSIETEFFKKLDDKWALLFQRLRNLINNKQIFPKDLNQLIQFISWQWARTPFFFDELRNRYPDLTRLRSFLVIFENVTRFQVSLNKKTLTFYKAPKETQFLTSDLPCFNYANYPVTFITLNSDYVLTWESSEKSIIQWGGEMPMDIVIKLNNLIASDAKRYVVGSDKCILEQAIKNSENHPGFREKLQS